MSHLFISYASADYREAASLCAFLETGGFKTWIAPRDIPAGRSHSAIVPQAIAESSAIVLLFTDAANGARYVPGEIQNAVDADKRVLPLRLTDVMPSGQLRYLLGQFQWIDAFRHPTDVWRGMLVAALHEKHTPPARTPQRDVALSPALLTAGGFAFLLAVIVSIVSVGADAPLLACSSGDEIGCWVTRNTLAAIAVLILAAAAAAPSFLTDRFRCRLAELRDVAAVGVSAALVLLGSLNYFISWFFAGVLGAILYFSVLRPWLDATRTMLAGAALAAVALAATAAEGDVLEAWRRSNPSVLSLFKPERVQAEGSTAERTAYDFFRNARRALELMSLPVTPTYARPEALTPAVFRTLRATRGSADLRNRFAQAILEWRPFSLVFTADAVPPAARCGDERWATLAVRIEDYELGEPPLWVWGQPRRPNSSAISASTFEFEMFAEVTASGDLEDPTLVTALVASSLADWIAARNGAPLLPQHKLVAAQKHAMTSLRTALVGTHWCSAPGAGIPSKELCSTLTQRSNAGMRPAIRKAVTEFAARSDPGEARSPFYGPRCAGEARREARLIARVETGEAP